METMAADEENHHQHPLMYLHANESAKANVKREREPNQSAAPVSDDEDKCEIMNANKSSSTSKRTSMKSFIIAIVLLLVVTSLRSMLQTYEVIDSKIATSAILLHHCHSFLVICASIVSKLFYGLRDIIVFLIASSSSLSSRSITPESMVIEQFQSRLQKGQQLLSQYKDISGSEMVCKSVANAVVLTANERKLNNQRRDSGDGETRDGTDDTAATSSSIDLPLSYSAIISLQLTQEESNLLSKSLSCVAEANLNVSQQQLDQRQVEYLTIAKSYLDNALMIDPTDPLIRANVGLTYLLLGTSSSSDGTAHNKSSVQFLLQSIQHLNVAIRILKSNNNDVQDESNEAVYMAALHNLGLANLAVDRFEGGNDGHYLEWINSLQVSQGEGSSLFQSSGLFLGNKGASLLENNEVDDAIVGLTSFVNEFCTSDEDSDEGTKTEKETRRESELCLIARHNLAAATGGSADVTGTIDVDSLIEHMTNDEVRHNTNETIEETPSVEIVSALSIEESSDVDNNVRDDLASSNTTGIPDDDNQANLNLTQVDVQHEEKEEEEKVQDKTNDVAEIEVDTPTPQVKTEMQNALAALEMAAESTKSSRLLLTLAKARVSAGDYSGAVDAALKAISAAKSEEETDTATSYLETLMDRIADEESGVVEAITDDSATHRLLDHTCARQI